jgi:hypothetical protein
VRVTWPNSGNLEFGCIRDAWLAYATRVVEEMPTEPDLYHYLRKLQL